MEENELMAAETFDREYGLDELLPISRIDRLMEEMAPWIPISIFSAGGEVYYTGAAALPASIEAAIETLRDQNRKYVSIEAGEARGLLFPLVHELDQTGYLCVHPGGLCDESGLAVIGMFMSRVLNELIFSAYQNKMTAGLHVQVVAESYHRLKEKAARLQLSEEKYRCLSENLELEVERKTREIRDVQLRALQQEKLASIGQLAAGVAHEINNPIGFVISNLNSLKQASAAMAELIRRYEAFSATMKDPDGPMLSPAFLRQVTAGIDRAKEELDIDFILEDSGQLIDESLEGARRVEAIVRQLRDFSRPGIEAAECLDINACLDNVLTILGSQTGAGVRIVKDYRPLPSIVGHLRELNQVFFQILHNALQAVGANGDIGIMTRSTDDAVEIRISDTGPGIRPEHQPRLFEPFFTTREVGQGTGLGLNLAYNIVSNHHGRIIVKSGVGQGTVMTVVLPVPKLT
jgi:two-component system, NtrC family, sensor kinase